MREEEEELSKFLENFSGIPLQHRKSPVLGSSWVFWREYDGSQNNSSSADLATTPLIQEKIISALSHIACHWGFLAQFWAPVTVDGGRRVLSTSGQPFAVGYCLSNELAKYRVYSEKYKYNINFDDVNQQLLHLNSEGDHMIIDGEPASAFLNRLPYFNQLHWIPSKEDCYKLIFSFMLPICFPSQSSSCIGVLELTLNHERYCLASLLFFTVKALKEAGLDVLPVQDLIPYKPKTSEKGKKPMVVDYVAPSKKKHKTTKIEIQHEEIVKQFGKTMNEAATSLGVSLSTFKRKFNELGIGEWRGPNHVKKKTNVSSIIQIDATKEDNRPIQDPSTVNMKEDRLTIKAEYKNEIIKFRLPNLEATFVTVEKKIGVEFKLSLGTYKLQYLDDAKEWIRLASDEDVKCCIESSIKNEIRLRVLQSITNSRGY